MPSASQKPVTLPGAIGMRVRLLKTSDPAWSRLLAGAGHDVYHLPGYVSMSASHEGGRPAALLVEADSRALLLPLIVRPLSADRFD